MVTLCVIFHLGWTWLFYWAEIVLHNLGVTSLYDPIYRTQHRGSLHRVAEGFHAGLYIWSFPCVLQGNSAYKV